MNLKAGKWARGMLSSHVLRAEAVGSALPPLSVFFHFPIPAIFGSYCFTLAPSTRLFSCPLNRNSLLFPFPKWLLLILTIMCPLFSKKCLLRQSTVGSCFLQPNMTVSAFRFGSLIHSCISIDMLAQIQLGCQHRYSWDFVCHITFCFQYFLYYFCSSVPPFLSSFVIGRYFLVHHFDSLLISFTTILVIFLVFTMQITIYTLIYNNLVWINTKLV